MDVSLFKKIPIMGILRGIEADIIEPIVETLVSSGLKAIEITMDTQGAPDAINLMSKKANGGLIIGAGTVLTLEDLHKAVDNGATFIVSPVFIPEVVEYCVKKNIPAFPGALTPLEIYTAWQAGATMVKVFPAKFFGPAYFKEVKAPLRDIELLACGGVNADNIQDYFSKGASAVAFGASIFKKEWLKERAFSRIEESIKSLIEKII